jgi:putative membrane protein
MKTVMRRAVVGVAALALSAIVSMSGAAIAVAAPNTQDTDYITSNGQTNLAEIAIGQLALDRAQNDSTRELAQMTLSDHQAALSKLQGVAAQLGVPVPTEPNAEQKQNAATLQAVSTAEFDVTYAQIQVAGHQKSIQGTNQEISAGADASLINYAEGYLPVATMHLEMAQKALADSGGTPAAVPAGTGGMAGTTPLSTMLWQIALVVLGGAGLVAGILLLRRQRSLH